MSLCAKKPKSQKQEAKSQQAKRPNKQINEYTNQQKQQQPKT